MSTPADLFSPRRPLGGRSTMGEEPTIQVSRDVPIRMTDGTRLFADIYHAGPSTRPGPVILQRTPYGKGAENPWARRFAAHGYTTVIQDCRGCGASEGELDFLWPEAGDGRSTVEWLAEQDFCDGRVAMYGTSWGAWTQTATAAAGTSALATIIPNQSGADAITSSVRHGGAFELRFAAWAFWHSAQYRSKIGEDEEVEGALNFDPVLASEWFANLPIRKGLTQLSQVPNYERWLLEIASNGDLNDRWTHPSVAPIRHIAQFPDMPVLLVGSWYDSYSRATMELFSALSNSNRGPVRAIMGPWLHGDLTTEETHAGDIDFGSTAALPSFQDIHLDWYDEFLRGADRGWNSAAPLRIFVMGGGTGHRNHEGRLDHGGYWRDEHEWPLDRAVNHDLYLGDAGELSSSPAARTASTTYRFDPTRPVPTIGGQFSSMKDLIPTSRDNGEPANAGIAVPKTEISRPGGQDQKTYPGLLGEHAPYLPLSARNDVIVFQTPPLARSVEVTGPVLVRMWVSSTALDTDFTAKLVDVYPASRDYPNGYALNLTDSIIRLRYREGPVRLTYEPNKIIEIEIELPPTSNVFAEGHRIRVDISSSNFPRFDVNPNTGEELWAGRVSKPALNTVFHGHHHPSRVSLPLVDSALEWG